MDRIWFVTGHTTEPETEPHGKAARKFARQMAHLLEQARNERARCSPMCH